MQHIKQYHRKVLPSSFRLNGYTLGFHPRTLTSESPVMVIQIHGYPDRTFLLPLFFLFYFFCFTEDVTALKVNKPKAEDDLNAEETSSEDEDELTQQ